MASNTDITAGAEFEDAQSFHILTGGPGSGKSTLLEALAAQGFQVMPEAGRAIIRQQLAIGGNGLPWADRALFAEQMLAWEMRSYEEAQRLRGPVFFDRGVPDVLGYLRLSGLEIHSHHKRAATALRYSRRVFVAPPWREIYTLDTERKQTFAEAEATHQAMVEIYSELDYKLVPLPFATVPERVRFVLETIQLSDPPKQSLGA